MGFKSFADKTKLEFHEGITAVVGPNGCGKSNIADAFRWVLGEQSSKSLRGGKMPDVIFAGTSHRKPLNFAEATITLENIGGKLPVGFEEVAVTRRVHRSGESEYFINRHPVRLKDIQSMFLDSGMGKDAYSIFEQGKIDQVINFSPLERRFIFEEAAGILRFLHRKKEALRKLEQVDLNVSRVKDIHHEVEKQIIVLEQQAEKARLYKENKAELDNLEKGVLFAKWEKNQKHLLEAVNKGKNINAQIAETQGQLEIYLGEIKESKHALSNAEKALQERNQEVYQARSAKEIKFKEQQSRQERLKEITGKEKRLQNELNVIFEKRKQREAERYLIQKIQKELEERLAYAENNLKEQREKTSTLDKELNILRRQQQSKQQEIVKCLQSENHSESELKQISLRIENGQERQEQLSNRIEKLIKVEGELISHLEEKKKLLDHSLREIDGQKDVFLSLEKKIHELIDEINGAQGQLDAILSDMAEAKARHKVLQRLRADMEGFSLGSKRLLQESMDAESPFFNKIKGLYEYIVPKKGEEGTIAIALKAYSQTLVIETENDFLEAISFAKQNDLKDFSLVCLETLLKAAKTEASSYTSAKLSSIIKNVVENALAEHFLKTVHVAKSFEDAFKVIQKNREIEILTKDGMFIDRRSVVFFAAQGENNIFLREAEIKAIESKSSELENEKQRLDAVLKAIQQKKGALQSERTELDKTIRRSEMKHLELNFSFQKMKEDVEKNRSEQNQLKAEIQQIVKTLEGYSAALEEMQQKYSCAKSQTIEAKRQGETYHEEMEKFSSKLKLEVTQLQKIEAENQQVVNDHRKQLHALHVLEVKDIESEQQEKHLKEEIKIGHDQSCSLKQSGSKAEEDLHVIEKTLSEFMEACKTLEQNVSVRKNGIEHLETKINDKRSIQKKHEAGRNQTDIQIAQLESQRLSLENELSQRHSLTIDEVQNNYPALEQSVDHAEKQIKVLRQQIENAGDINMASIEECGKHKERYEFLNLQMDDLNLSKQELIAIIAELDEESRKIFKSTFEQIRLNFKKNFNILFNGGEADLQFTDSSDVLEAGIDITAQPPGKQMRSISLLSGGEKCLTAMALLFAVFEVKPSPFCILDEIDAPLDDANVERFVNIIKEFVDRCQFIIITHNKRTMAIADVLFGVSMEEKGVSKLLSMDFSSSNKSKAEPALV